MFWKNQRPLLSEHHNASESVPHLNTVNALYKVAVVTIPSLSLSVIWDLKMDELTSCRRIIFIYFTIKKNIVTAETQWWHDN